ncbi:MAG: hypothetical protein JW751_02105 [Polyangiaceae bacterium]|nr:hypothetical protein [Polyangiaceae bacterium]
MSVQPFVSNRKTVPERGLRACRDGSRTSRRQVTATTLGHPVRHASTAGSIDLVEQLPAASLASLLGEPALRVVDLRWVDEDEATEHVPGATTLDIDVMVADMPLPLLAGAMAYRGIGDEHLVVVYDANGRGEAQRFARLLRAVGHQSTAVLAGGWEAWRAAGLPTARPWTRYPPTSFTARRKVA